MTPRRTVDEWTAEVEPHMMPVEHHASPYSCDLCHGFRDNTQPTCSSCRLTSGQVSAPLDRVIPITTTAGYTQMHTILRGYKSSRTPRAERRLMRIRLSAVLTRFLRNHEVCIGEWDALVVVPSSWREPPHPLEDVVMLSRFLRNKMVRPLVVADDPPTKRHASDRAYRTVEDVTDVRILLVDDTLTTGASIQGAASRLALDGNHVAGAVVLGRYVNPDWARNEERLEALRDRPFAWTTCCVHP